jgi:hypothetical protein
LKSEPLQMPTNLKSWLMVRWKLRRKKQKVSRQ